MTWALMREAAIRRHRWMNLVYEGGCPIRWARHMALIRAVYGW
jgi:hypothetical protein